MSNRPETRLPPPLSFRLFYGFARNEKKNNPASYTNRVTHCVRVRVYNFLLLSSLLQTTTTAGARSHAVFFAYTRAPGRWFLSTCKLLRIYRLLPPSGRIGFLFFRFVDHPPLGILPSRAFYNNNKILLLFPEM